MRESGFMSSLYGGSTINFVAADSLNCCLYDNMALGLNMIFSKLVALSILAYAAQSETGNEHVIGMWRKDLEARPRPHRAPTVSAEHNLLKSSQSSQSNACVLLLSME